MVLTCIDLEADSLKGWCARGDTAEFTVVAGTKRWPLCGSLVKPNGLSLIAATWEAAVQGNKEYKLLMFPRKLNKTSPGATHPCQILFAYKGLVWPVFFCFVVFFNWKCKEVLKAWTFQKQLEKELVWLTMCNIMDACIHLSEFTSIAELLLMRCWSIYSDLLALLLCI